MSLRAPAPRTLLSCLVAAAVAFACGVPGCIPDPLELATDAGKPSDAATDVDAGKPIDCHVACADSCMGANPTAACNSCMSTTCSGSWARVDAAPGVKDLDKCDQACTDAACHDACCTPTLQQACDAYWMLDNCACGYYLGKCDTVCTDLCGGGLPGTSCVDCVISTACDGVWYNWRYDATTAAFLQCENCADAGCAQACCTLYPTSCKLLDAVRKCVCPGG